MGGGAMLPPYTSTHSNNSFTTPPNFHSPCTLSSICDTPFGESWTKNRIIDYGSSYKSLDYGSYDGVDENETKGTYCHCAFGSVPSSLEVEKALSDLQRWLILCVIPRIFKNVNSWSNGFRDGFSFSTVVLPE